MACHCIAYHISDIKRKEEFITESFPKEEIKSISAKHLGLNKKQICLKNTDSLSQAGHLKMVVTDKSKNRNRVSPENLELDYLF